MTAITVGVDSLQAASGVKFCANRSLTLSARFITNLSALLLGAAILIFLYALGRPDADWIALGAGAGAVVLALYSFASAEQGVYQRITDVFIAIVGVWAIVAARVMNYRGDWLISGAGIALLGLGALGLVARELVLSRGLQVGSSRIGPNEFARMSVVQRRAEAHR